MDTVTSLLYVPRGGNGMARTNATTHARVGDTCAMNSSRCPRAVVLAWFASFAVALAINGCSADDGSSDVVRADRVGDIVAVGDGSDIASDATDGAPADIAECPGAFRCGAECCMRGQVCGGGRCCAPEVRCGAVCCATGYACREGFCERDCGAQAACGATGTQTCCAAGERCAFGACVTPGAPCDDITPCPAGSYCEPTLGRCLARAASPVCEYRPPAGMLVPRERYHWRAPASPPELATHSMVMMTPVVINLTDDNMDGRIDARDTPDIVFNAYSMGQYYSNGVTRAISGNTGRDLWPGTNPAFRVMPGALIATADLDPARPGPEIVTCTPKTGVTCCDGTAGNVIILGADGTRIREIPTVRCGYSAPAIADMNGDGVPEIAVRGAVFHYDGTVLFNRTADTGPISVEDFATLADLDGAADGNLELYTGSAVYRFDGTTVWSHTAAQGVGYPAVADLNPAAMDGPEVVVVQAGVVRAFRGRDGVNFPGWAAPAMIPSAGGGPPTIADFDGDGAADVATAGARNYAVFRGRDGTVLWTSMTQDFSSSTTGSSVFDFDGDGAAEAVYNDELRLRIYDGRTGMPRLDVCNTNGTLWENPVIVDVDNDDHAEIIVSQNPFAGTMCAAGGDFGIRVFAGGDAMTPSTWVRTRRIWNQHTYHVTNINEDGTVPRRETANWTVSYLNNFRQNVQPGARAAPDLRGEMSTDLTMCPRTITLRVRVTNIGAAGAPAGVGVTVYSGTPGMMPTRLGRRVLTRSLLPGESEVVSVMFTVPMGMQSSTFSFFAVIDDAMDMPLAELRECDRTNNQVGPVMVMCDSPL